MLQQKSISQHEAILTDAKDFTYHTLFYAGRWQKASLFLPGDRRDDQYDK